MPFSKNLKMLNQDTDKRTAISVIRDEIKILKSQAPSQNIVFSPLVRDIPSDISGFFLDAELGLVILIKTDNNGEINISYNNEDKSDYLNGTTFRIINVGDMPISINMQNNTSQIPSSIPTYKKQIEINSKESYTIVYYSTVPCWINIPGLANFVNFTNY
jgi:hypothetical protein